MVMKKRNDIFHRLVTQVVCPVTVMQKSPGGTGSLWEGGVDENKEGSGINFSFFISMLGCEVYFFKDGDYRPS
jgi:hypothetical protein